MRLTETRPAPALGLGQEDVKLTVVFTLALSIAKSPARRVMKPREAIRGVNPGEEGYIPYGPLEIENIERGYE